MHTQQQIRKQYFEQLAALYPKNEISMLLRIISEELFGQKIILETDEALPIAKSNRFLEILEQLKRNEPIQYILGHAPFYGADFQVNTSTLIPRPETEELVDLVINHHQTTPDLRILDIGTGSGCIAISLAKHLKSATVHGFDISSDALLIAETNSKLNQVHVDFFEIDILQQDTSAYSYDIIVSNPPYVTEFEKKSMAEHVLAYEPHQALFVSDEDPLIFYRQIARFAQQHLNAGGYLYFEINQYLSTETISLLRELSFENISLVNDINNAQRMVYAQRTK